VLGAVGVVAVLVATWWVTLYVLQGSMMYPAPRPGTGPAPGDVRQIWLETAHGRVEAWFLPPVSASGPAPLLIFAHGNGELIEFWPEEFGVPRSWGVGVLLVEFPGYGRSAGRPS